MADTLTLSGSLLSRISSTPPASVSAGPMRKRNSPEDNEERPLKRRFVSEDTSSCAKEYRIPVWLDPEETYDDDSTRESRLHREIKQFISYITPSSNERKARSNLVQRIETLLKGRWSDTVVTLFGSSSTGLELSGGDIDLVVSFGSSPRMSEPDKKRRLASIGDLLRKSGLTSWVNRIFGARVPIISFVTTVDLGEISFDISIRNDEDTGPRAIPIVKQYLQEMPALRTLILAVKMFLSLRDLNDASQSSLSSYAVTILCISFLQRNPARRPKEYLEDPDSNNALGILLMDFFRHYGHDFSYATHYISVTDKGVFTKKSKNWGMKGNSTSFLAVQCLLIPENNITRGCGKIQLIVEAFKEAYYALQNTPLSDSHGIQTPSLLESIYELPDDMSIRRQTLEEMINSGAFDRAVEAIGTGSNAPSRAVSGGVVIGSQHGGNDNNSNKAYNKHRPTMRFGPGPLSGKANTDKIYQKNQRGADSNGRPIQRLPTLHWTYYRDRQRALNATRLHQQQQSLHSSSQFDFHFQPPGMQNVFSTMQQQQQQQQIHQHQLQQQQMQQQQMLQQYQLQMALTNNGMGVQQIGSQTTRPTMLGNQHYMPINHRPNKR